MCEKCESFLHRCSPKRGRQVPEEGIFLSSNFYDPLTIARGTKREKRSQSSPERRGEHRNERSEDGAQPRNLAERPKDGGTKRSPTDSKGSTQRKGRREGRSTAGKRGRKRRPTTEARKERARDRGGARRGRREPGSERRANRPRGGATRGRKRAAK